MSKQSEAKERQGYMPYGGTRGCPCARCHNGDMTYTPHCRIGNFIVHRIATCKEWRKGE